MRTRSSTHVLCLRSEVPEELEIGAAPTCVLGEKSPLSDAEAARLLAFLISGVRGELAGALQDTDEAVGADMRTRGPGGTGRYCFYVQVVSI